MIDNVAAYSIRRHTIKTTIRLLHLRNRTLNAEKTTRIIPGRHNNMILGQTVRRKLKVLGLYFWSLCHGNISIWKQKCDDMGGKCHNGRLQLKINDFNLNALRYRNEGLGPIFLSFIRQSGFNHVFQQDNARCHVARIFM